MQNMRQDTVTIKFSLNKEAPYTWRKDTPPWFVKLHGYTADAFRKMFAAGKYGVHLKEFRRDALARFAQNNILFKCFADSRRGGGKREEWCRLDYPDWYDLEIVDEAMAEAA